ncbi:MAG: VOC family protein [Balneolales bacterium]
MIQFKPAGYNSVSPYFVVKDADKLIDLLKDLFDAVVLRRYDMPDGTLLHGEVGIDDSVVMMGTASEEYPPNQLLVHVYVPDVDETFDKAIDAGCQVINEPQENEGDPDRRGIFKDFEGNLWSIATQVEK